ncbi:unnamed protein product [Rotaria sordida]|uniref:SARAH domain-containing protein n=1 Tax=Rotaria sordida TaxID=392033 RepID=A0A818VIV9_9BILA|nr:unnamed protein product [Rotaria sordida]
MPKKKQVAFQSNIPGKFIPRDDPPSASGFRFGTNTNRFNSKMVELLASSESSSITPSSTRINNENESILNITKSSQNDPTLSTSPDMATIDSSRIHSRLFHRRIVTMLDTLKRRSGNNGPTSPPTSPKILPSYTETKSQPITFGQLRQATISSATHTSTIIGEVSSSKVLTARSYNDLTSINTTTNVKSLTIDTRSDLKSISINKSSSKYQTNKERLYYSPSLEQLLEQHNVVPRMKQQDELKQEQKEEEQQQQQQKPPLTVDEILATYYSKVNIPTTIETRPSPPPPSTHANNNNMGFYIHPSPLRWNTPQTNQPFIPPSPLVLNEQNRNRPPPPSYSFSIANGHRPPPPANNLGQHLIHLPVPSSIPKQVYNEPQITQHLLSRNSPVTLPTSSSPIMMNTPVRPPPPRYELPISNIERPHSALSSMNHPNYSQTNPPQAGFDREFSRLLYGKDGGKNRHQQQKRKAFSDPVKKSVEEAGRSIEKTHRRLTPHLNTTDTVNEEEENTNDSNNIDKQERSLFSQRRFQQQSDFTVNNRESAKKPIVPPNPLLKRPIPSFLHVYSQASSSNDILLQWHLFSLSELESFDAMMTKLYRDENFIRVQYYENYRGLLTSILESKKSLNKVRINDKDDDGNTIATTAL